LAESATRGKMDAVRRHHTIDYIEFSAPDLDRAKAFYEAAFGWAFNTYGPDYMGIQDGEGGECGGFAKAAAEPGGPLVILFSTDLEATRRAVEAAGGTIVKAPFDFPGGRRFHFSDPAGNTLAVWTESAQ